MILFKNMFGWLLVTRKSGVAEHPDINPLDIEELTKELKIDQHARRLGETGLPRSDDTMLSGPEMAIIQRLESTRRNYQNWASVKLKIIHDRMITFDITKTFNRVIHLGDEFEREANRRVSDEELNLRRLQSIAHKKQEDLKQFREKNKLARSAKEVSGLRITMFILMTVGIVVVEGALNAQFFASGVEGGLIEGFAFAVLLAGVNVGVALSFGLFGVPNKNHVNPVKRVIGHLSWVTSLVLMVVIGLMIAHVRDSLSNAGELDSSQVMAMAKQTLLEDPLGLNDVLSILLWVVSFLFGLLSLVEGYNWRDSYPGYGKAQKEANLAQHEYEDAIAEMRSELEGMKDDYLVKLEEDLEKSKISVLEFKTQVEDKRSARHRLQRALDKAENMLAALVTIFRTENEIYRKPTGTPTPAYFKDKLQFQVLELPDFSTTTDEQSLEKQERMLSELLSKIENIRAQIQSSYDLKFDQLKPIREQI